MWGTVLFFYKVKLIEMTLVCFKSFYISLWQYIFKAYFENYAIISMNIIMLGLKVMIHSYAIKW